MSLSIRITSSDIVGLPILYSIPDIEVGACHVLLSYWQVIIASLTGKLHSLLCYRFMRKCMRTAKAMTVPRNVNGMIAAKSQ